MLLCRDHRQPMHIPMWVEQVDTNAIHAIYNMACCRLNGRGILLTCYDMTFYSSVCFTNN